MIVRPVHLCLRDRQVVDAPGVTGRGRVGESAIGVVIGEIDGTSRVRGGPARRDDGGEFGLGVGVPRGRRIDLQGARDAVGISLHDRRIRDVLEATVEVDGS